MVRRRTGNILGALLFGWPVYADVCWLPLPDDQAFQAASAVFVGTVTEMTSAAADLQRSQLLPFRVHPSWIRMTVTTESIRANDSFVWLRVKETRKGQVGHEARVRTRAVESCGVHFIVGATYLVYAGEGLEVSSVMPTRKLGVDLHKSGP